MKSNLIKITKAGHGAEYTSLKRALRLIEKGVAEWLSSDSIALKDREEPIITLPRHTDAKIPGNFNWRVGESAGFQVMQADHTVRA